MATDPEPAVMVAVEAFDSISPVTGATIATFPAHSADEVRAVVEHTRTATQWWSGLGFDGRRTRLLAWKRALYDSLDELADLVHRENGKTVDEAVLEIGTHLDILAWTAAHAGRVLGTRRVPRGLLTANQAASVTYQPYGVVGVIGTWNWPVYTPGGAIVSALAAGNCVVYKPSELTPAVGRFVVEKFAAVVGEHPVLRMVTGRSLTGAALCSAGVDKLSFVGAPATGRAVMAQCAKTLTPVVLELGGKDAMIVADDADLDAAVDGALWLGIGNSGQTCIATERIFVTDGAYDAFLAKLIIQAKKITAGAGKPSGYGPMVLDSQIELIQRHLRDALARGGRAVVGGPESVRPPFVDPIVLVDVPDDALAMTEETFGPTLVVTRVRDLDEAVARANSSVFGLGASVFSRRRGREIADRLRVGMVSVNNVMVFTAVAGLPFGGVGHSGFGRVQGADGLREFAWPKAMTVRQIASPVNPISFFRKPSAMRRYRALTRMLHGQRAKTDAENNSAG
ncbi:aldehyde dehydrogenase family protein [Frankia sp. CIT1]|uniref:aldehyde dehydrogenase family protein n=1 Tax=Frankia sp. CIT1 TaxID=2880974 RepID=UPI001EF4C704|nr:aldehyde dehydrogenase family protein [Frankia sp. CIT1]